MLREISLAAEDKVDGDIQALLGAAVHDAYGCSINEIFKDE
jgi:hypothetical protein